MANAQVNVRFVPNGRGGQYLVYLGFKFSIKSRRVNSIHWRCCRKDCTATINTRDNIVTSFGDPHNHEDDSINIRVAEFVSLVKALGETTSTPIPSIYKEELAGMYPYKTIRSYKN